MTLEQKKLVDKARRSLEGAKILLDQGYPEFAAPRAYYSMFYLAQALLAGRGLSYSSHSAVISAFGKEFVKTGKVSIESHRNLLEAMNARHEGDYSFEDSVTLPVAELQIERAEKFLAETAAFLGKEPDIHGNGEK